MELRLCSGVRVSVQENGNFKLLFFDRPVKAMELSQEESAQLGSFLLKGDGHFGVTAELRSLIRLGFFADPRNFAAVRKELTQKGAKVASPSLNRILTKLVERGELFRSGQKGGYVYRRELNEEKKEAFVDA